MLYSLKHPADESESQEAVTESQKQSGLSAYKQDQETGKTSITSLLAAA